MISNPDLRISWISMECFISSGEVSSTEILPSESIPEVFPGIPIRQHGGFGFVIPPIGGGSVNISHGDSPKHPGRSPGGLIKRLSQ
jgi:hypothetical protein